VFGETALGIIGGTAIVAAILVGISFAWGSARKDNQWIRLALKKQENVSDVLAETPPDDPFDGMRPQHDPASGVPKTESGSSG
jgi:hypothetical protein